MNDQQLEEVTSFQYLTATSCKDCTRSMAVTASLNRIWRCNTISFAITVKLYMSLVTFILFYVYETWTLLADSEKRIQAFET